MLASAISPVSSSSFLCHLPSTTPHHRPPEQRRPLSAPSPTPPPDSALHRLPSRRPPWGRSRSNSHKWRSRLLCRRRRVLTLFMERFSSLVRPPSSLTILPGLRIPRSMHLLPRSGNVHFRVDEAGALRLQLPVRPRVVGSLAVQRKKKRSGNRGLITATIIPLRSKLR